MRSEMGEKDFYEKKRLIGNSSVLVLFDQNFSEKEAIESLQSDMNFVTFWVRREAKHFFSVKVIHSVDVEPSLKIGGIFTLRMLGRLMRFWICKSAELAEAWKEELTKADWDSARNKVDFRKKFKEGIGKSLEIEIKNQWRNIFKRKSIIEKMINCIRKKNFNN